jgi:multiple antibiotic resistance protein
VSLAGVMDISLFVRTFVAVFVLADALGNAPVFLVLTKGMEIEERNSVVDRASLIATSVLLGFTFVGQPILNYLHISMSSLEVAGGLLLLLIALDMLRGDLNEPVIQEEKRDIAVTPLALPLLAGPGTLTTVMLLVSDSPNAYISVVAGIVAAMLVTWFIVRQAARIDKWIGPEGATIATQLLGFLLAALAIEIGAGGLRELLTATTAIGWG